MKVRSIIFILSIALISFASCLPLSGPQDFIKIPIPVPKAPTAAKTPEQIEFESKMKVFNSNESMALEVFGMPDTISKDEMLYEIKDRGIYYWNENNKIVDEIEQMDLPDHIKPVVPVLRNYCALRIKSIISYIMPLSGERS
ncbi:MAG: hypothetical protein V4594_01815 [Bacteroidota bacterium]